MTTKSERAGREALLESARRLFLERGYSAVSMQQIAEAAGMTKGAPYYHFKNKDDLFVSILVEEIERQRAGFVEVLNQPGSDEDRLTLAVAFALGSTQADLFTLFSDARRHLSEECLKGPAFKPRNADRLDAILVPFFEEMEARGRKLRISPERASHLFMLLMLGQIHALHSEHKLPRETKSSRDMAAELVDVLLHGLI
ncbi:MAG: TetR/AcrR family transcriptional regulator [Microbacterium sp.]|nr:TetR/AcrR family transcriptional regulator [Microbacterium sp.]